MMASTPVSIQNEERGDNEEFEIIRANRKTNKTHPDDWFSAIDSDDDHWL